MKRRGRAQTSYASDGPRSDRELISATPAGVSESDRSEAIGGETLLSVLVLESLTPVRGGEFEDALIRPRGQQAEQIAEIGPGFDAVELATRQEGDKDGVRASAIVATDEQPVLPSYGFASKVTLADVVGDRQAAIIEKSLEGFLLVERIIQRLRDRRFVENDFALRHAPFEERVDNSARFLGSNRLALFSRGCLKRALDSKQPLHQRQRVLGTLWVGRQRLKEVASTVGPASDRKSLGKEKVNENMNGNLPKRPRGFDSPVEEVSNQPQASLAWRAATYVLKRRQRVLKLCDRASTSFVRWGLHRVGCEGSISRPVTQGAGGPAGVYEQGKGTGWVVQEPVRSHDRHMKRRVGPRHQEEAWLSGRRLQPERAKRGQHVGLGRESIRGQEQT